MVSLKWGGGWGEKKHPEDENCLSLPVIFPSCVVCVGHCTGAMRRRGRGARSLE